MTTRRNILFETRGICHGLSASKEILNETLEDLKVSNKEVDIDDLLEIYNKKIELLYNMYLTTLVDKKE